MKQTPNLALPIVEGTDEFYIEDMNKAMDKIDSEIFDLHAAVEGAEVGLRATNNEIQKNETQRVIAENQRLANEQTRVNNENERVAKFNSHDSDYLKSEAARDTKYNTSETSRDTKYNTAEASRDTKYNTAEQNRSTSFNNSQSDRDSRFNASQSDRDNRFNASEVSRSVTFNKSEADRNANLSAWNDRLTALSQAASNSSIAQSVVSEVIAARTTNQGKTFATLNDRFDSIEDKVTTRDYTEINTNGANIVSLPNSVDGEAKLSIEGSTLINLLGSNGNCEDLSKWSLGGIAQIDSTNKLFGNNSIKVSPVNGVTPGYIYKDILLDSTHKYLFSANINITSYTSGIMIVAYYDYGTFNNPASNNFDSTKLNQWQKKSHVISGKSGVRLFVGSGVSTAIANIDGVTVYDLTQFYGAGKEPTDISLLESQLPYIDGIKSVGELEGNTVGVVSCAVNRINPNTLFSRYATKTNIDGFDCVSAIADNIGKYYNNPDILNCKSNTQYILKYSIKSDSQVTNPRMGILYTDGTRQAPAGTAGVWSNITITSQAGKTVKGIYLDYSSGSGNVYIRLDNITLYEGTDINKPYEPYKEDKKSISLTQPLCSLLNGTRDYALSDGSVKRNVGKTVLNGGENWVLRTDLSNPNTIAFLLDAISNAKTSNSFTDKFIYKNDTSDTEHYFDSNSSKGITVFINKSKLATQDLAGFKAYLQANPVTILYELATPTTENTGIPLNISTFENGTIQYDGAVAPNIKCLYPTNLTSAIKSLRDYAEFVDTQLASVWITALRLADRELKMKSVSLLTTNTNDDIKNKVNEILNLWR